MAFPLYICTLWALVYPVGLDAPAQSRWSLSRCLRGRDGSERVRALARFGCLQIEASFHGNSCPDTSRRTSSR